MTKPWTNHCKNKRQNTEMPNVYFIDNIQIKIVKHESLMLIQSRQNLFRKTVSQKLEIRNHDSGKSSAKSLMIDNWQEVESLTTSTNSYEISFVKCSA